MNEAVPYQINYLAQDHQIPFEKWFRSLRDPRTRAVIRIRIDRLSFGLFGNSRDVGGGVWELKIDFGPGYRIYYSIVGRQVVLLLTGGDKGTQTADIRRAKELFYGWKRSNKNS